MKPKHIPHKTVALLILIGLIVSALFLPQLQALDRTEQNTKDIAAFLISTIQNANQSITQTISNLEGKDVLLPQTCIDTFRETQVLVNQATGLNQQGDYAQAIDLALLATQKIRDTLNLLDGLADQATTEQVDNYKQTLQNTIDRNYALLQRYENIATSALNQGTDVSAIKSKLSAIKTILDSATLNLEQENFELTEKEITRAQALIGELTGYFNTIAANLNVERITVYIDSAQQDLTALREQVNSPSSSLTPIIRAAASATITQAQTSLDKAKQYLDSQQIRQTIAELSNVQANQATVQSYLNSASPTLTATTPTTSPNVSITNSTSTTTSTTR